MPVSKEMLECAYAHTLKRQGQYVLHTDFCNEFNALFPDDRLTPDMVGTLFKDYEGVKFIDDFVSRDVQTPSKAFRLLADKRVYGWDRINRIRLILMAKVSAHADFEGIDIDDVVAGASTMPQLLSDLRFTSLAAFIKADPSFMKIRKSPSGKLLLFRATPSAVTKTKGAEGALPAVETLPPDKVEEFRKMVSDRYDKAVAQGKPALLAYFGDVKPLAQELLGCDKVKQAILHLVSDKFSMIDVAEPGHPAVLRLVRKTIRRERKKGPFDKTGLVLLYTINGREVMKPLPIKTGQNDDNKGSKPQLIFGDKQSAHAKFMSFSAFPKKFPEVIRQLAAKAIDEVWSYDDSEPMSILRNYLDLTFERLLFEDSQKDDKNKKDERNRKDDRWKDDRHKDKKYKIRVSDDGSYAVFNTGLFDSLYDPIYAVFNRNTKEVVPQPWIFRMFTTVNERGGQELVRKFAGGLPEAASYYSSPSELVYDVRCRIATIHIDHIIDRVKRLPIDFLIQTVPGFDFSREHDDNFYAELIAFIKRNVNVKYIIKSRLEEAVKVAENKVRWNFKTAVPIYYPEKKKISMLLPLVLGNNEDRPDVALVLEATKGGYIAHTVLTMKQAFNNARLVSRPDYLWLAIDRLTPRE